MPTRSATRPATRFARRAALLAAATMALAPLAQLARAQDSAWPIKPVKLIVPYAPGGGVDRTARIVAQRLGVAFNQQFVVENRPGAGTVIAAEAAAKADPDGYTLLTVAPAILTVNPGLMPNLPYKVEDLVPVAMVGKIPLFVVTAAEGGAKTVGELFDKARQKDTAYGSAGNGSMTHLGAELIKLRLGARLTHVPYKGTAAMLPDLSTGRVEFALSDLGPIKGLVDGGKLRVLASASAARSALLPSAPSMVESGYQDIDVATWVGVAAPRGTPARVLERLATEINRILADAAARGELVQAGVEPTPMDSAAFAKMVSDERARWRDVIKAGNITAN